eukprot:scaffold4942_cov417-Prasinococcus_capsulatus_cf.AAC.1
MGRLILTSCSSEKARSSWCTSTPGPSSPAYEPARPACVTWQGRGERGSVCASLSEPGQTEEGVHLYAPRRILVRSHTSTERAHAPRAPPSLARRRVPPRPHAP